MSGKLRAALIAITCGLALIPVSTWAETYDFGGPAPRIVNGLTTQDFPTTGALLLGGNPLSATSHCSGTLIGCETFLTAAHCVEENLDPGSYTVYLQHGGMFSVTSIAVHPSYSFPVADVAVLKLGSPVTGISPTAIDVIGGQSNGSTGTIAGFGRTGGGAFDYGIKRYGEVSIADCQFGTSDTTSICWDFENPVGAPGEDSNTCNADSGGPLFTDNGSGVVVAGITSGGNSSNCLAYDNSFDTRVFFYQSFIQTEGGADISNTSCGEIPQVGETAVEVSEFEDSLSGGTPQQTHSFVVGAGANVLRVSFNGIDDELADFDFYVRAGSAPTTSLYDCGASGANQFGSCEFTNPASGTWYVLVDRFSGAGPYQVTATTFTSFCSDPGNEGMTCDDANDCTTLDTCVLGSCVGTPLADGTSCDDGNACSTPDACAAGVCVGQTTCGDGTIQASCEECDDGALLPGDGCDASCSVESCYGCSGEPSSCGMPTGCAGAGKSILLLKNDGDGSRDRLTWKWRKGTTVTSAFGDPRGADGYGMCIWENGSLVARAGAAAGGVCGSKPCWKATGGSFAPNGYKYRNSDSNGDGVFQVVLKEGNGSAKILWKGRGENLMMPAPANASQYFSGSDLVIQTVRDNGSTCWESTFASGDFKRNTPEKFKAVK